MYNQKNNNYTGKIQTLKIILLGGKYMKYVVVGTSHFGYEAVQTIFKKTSLTLKIHLYERGAGGFIHGLR